MKILTLLHRSIAILFLLGVFGCATKYQREPPPQEIKKIPPKTDENTISREQAIDQDASLGIKVSNHARKNGAYVIDFHNEKGESPAKIAGIEKYDLIIRIGDCTVNDTSTYLNCLKLYKPYETVLIKIDRDGKIYKGNVLLGGRKDFTKTP